MRIFTCVVAATFVAFVGAENALADAEEDKAIFPQWGPMSMTTKTAM